MEIRHCQECALELAPLGTKNCTMTKIFDHLHIVLYSLPFTAKSVLIVLPVLPPPQPTQHQKPLLRKSSSAGVSCLSGHTDLQRPANLMAQPMLRSAVPSLTKSSSWTQGVIQDKAVGRTGSEMKKGRNLVTVVQNVREAHQCMEIGENCQFFEEAHYLLDNINPSQPLHVRCLG